MTDKQLFHKYFETRDVAVRNKIVEENLFMVDILIRKYMGKGVERDDLSQVGAMALIAAVDRFDPNRGFEFSSFATPTILGEIKKYFRDKGWSVKVPRRLKEISVAMSRVKEELAIELGRSPKVSEIAAKMNVKEDEVLQAMESSMAYGTYSLSEPLRNDDEGGSSAPMLEKFIAKEETGYGGVESREIINSVLENLNDTSRYIFRERFIEEKSQAEIAKELGVSQMTISRAEKNIKERFASELQK